MFSHQIYPQVLLAVAGGLLTLLGSVGIFISLIVQRRVERLQDILEEFINLSYRNETNLTGQMYNLIEKYQMHYLFPREPHLQLLHYIDINIFLILLLWCLTLFTGLSAPFTWRTALGFFPLVIGLCASLFFRSLLRNTINLENPLLGALIPSPPRLRSISYLSHFVNVSVKSVLKQARLTLLLKKEDHLGETSLSVILKEELSFDDFFYYLAVSSGQEPLFISFGEIHFLFPPDTITGKPVPVQRNINIPLGSFRTEKSPDFTARLLIFTKGEKHPVEYHYILQKETSFFSSQSDPELKVNHQIMYLIKGNRLQIFSCEADLPYFCELSRYYYLKGERYYLEVAAAGPEQLKKEPPVKRCREDCFID